MMAINDKHNTYNCTWFLIHKSLYMPYNDYTNRKEGNAAFRYFTFNVGFTMSDLNYYKTFS